jgi:hypothetical protein
MRACPPGLAPQASFATSASADNCNAGGKRARATALAVLSPVVRSEHLLESTQDACIVPVRRVFTGAP